MHSQCAPFMETCHKICNYLQTVWDLYVITHDVDDLATNWAFSIRRLRLAFHHETITLYIDDLATNRL